MHWVVDIETLCTTPNAFGVTSFAFVGFTPGKQKFIIGPVFSISYPSTAYIKHFDCVDTDTAAWRSKNHVDDMEKLIPCIPVEEAAFMVHSFIKDRQDAAFWGNSPMFDMQFLSLMCAEQGWPVVWPKYTFDLRTLRVSSFLSDEAEDKLKEALKNHAKEDLPAEFGPHSAFYDAFYEAHEIDSRLAAAAFMKEEMERGFYISVDHPF